MNHKRILAIHDISCVGRCSLTVALPIVSSVGIECSVLPTAVLSTHTGGFTGYTYRDLTSDMMPIDEHWKTLDIKFDAFYSGFLGSFEQIDIVEKLFDDLSHEGSRIYVDPVMADKGKLYPVFGPDFPAGMRKLCEKAHVIMPNMTELALMLGEEYVDGPYTKEYVESMFEKARVFGSEQIVITGVSFQEGMVGAVYMDYRTGETGEVMRPEIPGYYHGTGDVFGSLLVASLESGLSLADGVKAAVDFTVESIVNTHSSGEDVRYGVNFEPGLERFARTVRSSAAGMEIVPAITDTDLRIISSLARSIWYECYEGIVPRGQTDYMLERYLSFESLKEQIAEGYVYLMAVCKGEPVGFVGYKEEDDHVFLSKLYILKEHRGKGYSGKLIGRVCDVARAAGLGSIRLTVNRSNVHSVEIYEHCGFVKLREEDNPIGGGFVMNDFIMEKKV